MQNNHGWSLREMLLWICMFIIALLIVAYNCSRLMKGVSFPFGKEYTYASIEEKITQAATKYLEEQYQNEIGLGTLVVSTDNLVKYSYIKEAELKTDKQDTCKGYSLISKENNTLQVNSYIKCDKYETKDYQGWRIGE